MHYTYLIRADGENATKIGHSCKPARRVSQLRVSTSHELHVAHQWRGPRARQITLEGDLHLLLQWARIRGEWFSLDVDEIVTVGDALVMGHHDRAERLSALLEGDAALKAAEAAATKRLASVKPFTPREVRDEIFGELEDVGRKRSALRDRLCELGLPPNEWDDRLRVAAAPAMDQAA